MTIKKIQNKLSKLQRKWSHYDERFIREYQTLNSVTKLHIGCGGNALKTWLNTNYMTQKAGEIHLDASAEFPFGDSSFDYVFSEHMIEHINYKSGKKMLSECFRILKKGGKIRIATPDFDFLIALASPQKSALQQLFIEHTTKKYLNYAPGPSHVFVVNNHFRGFGHQFIYDQDTLTQLLNDVGFSKITRYPVRISDDETLANLEHTKRKPDGLLDLESLILEAVKE